MKKIHLLSLFISFLAPSIALGQIAVNANNNAAQLAQFISGPGVEISNATLRCGNNQIGYFDATNANLDLVEGIVLDNGNINDIVGPNNAAGTGGGAGGLNDPDLAAIAADVITDACILEFDVVPRGDTLKFRYQFASEEYPEYAPPNSSSFNDVFGFFFSGPGIAGPYTNNAINIALVPGTTIPVGVNTINPITNNQYYINNGNGGNAPFNADNRYIEYDGLTKILTAVVPVDPCLTYHLKLGVSDAGSGLVGPDAILSSCVFIEKGSLVSIERELEPILVNGGQPKLIEGCYDGSFNIKLTDPAKVDKSIELLFRGTATYGTDYDSIPTTIIIPQGQQIATVNISSIQDTLDEGTETIEVCILDPCDGSIIGCQIIEIIDFKMDVSDDIDICRGDFVDLFATGESISSWDWQPNLYLNNNTIEDPRSTPLDTTVYTVTVSNGNCTLIDSVTVNVNAPEIFAGTDKQFCIGSGDILDGELISGNPFTTPVTWTPGTGLNRNDTLKPTLTLNTTGVYEYIITALDAGGCTDSDTVEITVFESPDAEIEQPVQVCLLESVQLEGSGGLSYQWEPASRFPNPNSDIVTLSNAQKIDSSYFYLTVTDINNCSNTDSVFVTVLNLPVIDPGPDATVCESEDLQLNVSGAQDYVWAPVTGLSSNTVDDPVTNLTASIIYTITGTDANGCVNDTTLPVTVFPTNFATTAILPEICVNEKVDFASGPDNAATYVWNPKTNLSNANSQNPEFTGKAAGTYTYTVTVTLSNGCVDTEVISVTVNPLPVVTPTPASAEFCFGESADVNFPPQYSYTFLPPNNVANLGGGGFRFDPDQSVSYEVTATDAKGCQKTVLYPVTVRGLPDAPLNDKEICIGSSTTLNATSSGAQTYSWTPTTGVSDPNIAAPTFNPTATTNYVVNIIDIYGCSSDLPVQIKVNQLPLVNAGPDIQICQNDTTTLLGSGNGTVRWNPPTDLNSPTLLKPTIIPRTVGTFEYVIRLTDANSCVNTDTVSVEVTPLPTLATTNLNPNICSYESTTLDINGAVTYRWNPATGLNTSTGNSVISDPDQTTVYTVTGTDANGCRNTFINVVTIKPDAIAIYNGTPEICAGDSIQLTPENENAFVWSPTNSLDNPNANNPTAFPAGTTTYTFISTNLQGCSDTSTVTLTVNQNPIADAGVGRRICIFDSTLIGASQVASSGTPTYTYQWLPNTNIVDATVSNPTVFPTVPTYYSVIVTDSKGCDDTSEVLVDTFNLPIISANQDVFICPEDTALLNGFGPTGTTFEWSPKIGIFSPFQAVTNARPSQTTQYILGGTDVNGCYNQDTMLLTVYPAAVAEAGPDDEMCIGQQSVQLNASGGVDYDWTPGIAVSDSLIGNPIGFPGVSIYMKVRVYDANGCTDLDSMFITVHDLPTITTNLPDTIICDGDSIQLSAFGAQSYVWKPAQLVTDEFSQTTQVFPLSPQVFTVIGTDANSCYDSTLVYVDIHPDIIPIVNDDIICPEDTTILEVINNNQFTGYVWGPTSEIVGSNTASSIIVSPDFSQIYSLTARDINTCFYSIEKFLPVYPKAEANIELSLISLNGERRIFKNGIVKGETHQFFATGGVTYEWSPPLGISNTNTYNPMVFADTNTIYTLNIVDQNGCVDTTTFDLRVINKTFIYVPTAFTPNGDGENDFFFAIQRNEFDFGSLTIFNRWGNPIFRGESIDDRWDGTFNGEKVPVGAYAYVITGTDWQGLPFRKMGSVTVIR